MNTASDPQFHQTARSYQRDCVKHARFYALAKCNVERRAKGFEPIKRISALWWRLFGKEATQTIQNWGAYTLDREHSVWFWIADDRPCTPDECSARGIPCNPVAQAAAHAASIDLNHSTVA